MKLFNGILNALFPQKCVACGRVVCDDEFLCEFCAEMISKTDLSKVCTICGCTKKNCQCKHRVFHFDGCVSPFVNIDISRAAMYRFKFGKISRGGEFFAQEMAKAVKQQFGDIDFDGIACVPMHPLRKLKRGFNQSFILAQKLSEICGIPIYHDVLLCVRRNRKQHNMSFKERFENVKGLYSCKYKVNGKTILLVDDIKTTGASLDACAKQLLSAGADKVYCVTGLIGEPKKGSLKNGN